MTLLDVAAVALVVILAFVEWKRCAPTAAVDLALALLVLALAKQLADMGLPSGLEQGAAFGFWFVVLALAAGVASWAFDNRTKWDIGAFDNTIAGVIGFVTGLVLAHGMFHVAHLAGGNAADMAKASLLNSEIYDLRTLKAIGQMFANLGGGKRISDEVQEQMK